jgi:hypothetical protein
LYSKIQDIKYKAEQSEQMVQNITKDIKSLDTGKKNLTLTITALQRLHMLVSAVDQLKVMSTKKQYRKAAEKLLVANQLIEFFEPFKQIQKIQNLIEDVDAVKSTLQTQIFKDFKSLDAHEGVANVPQLLSDACMVIDALGVKIRSLLIQQFTKQQISLYKMIYSGKNTQKSKAKDLDRDIKKRIEWINNTLTNYEKMFAQVFPDHWSVRQELIIEFCLATRDDIAQILFVNKDSLDGLVVYRSVNNIIKFERKMHDRFYVKTEVELQSNIKKQQQQLLKEVEELKDVNSLEATKKRVKMMILQRDLDRQAKELETSLEASDDKPTGRRVQKNYNFIGFISSVFEDYIDVYIGFEDKNMQEVLITVCTQETWNDLAGKNRYAQELFMNIQSGMEKCLALSRGKVLIKMLEQVWKKYLRRYADFLSNNLPKIPQLTHTTPAPKEDTLMKLDRFSLSSLITGQDSSASQTPKPVAKVQFSEDEEKQVCYIVNLAIYCQENIEVLQDMLKMAVDDLYVKQIDLRDEVNVFYKVLKAAVEQLVQNLKSYVEGEFNQITQLRLSATTEVLDQSPYVTSIIQHLSDALPYLSELIPTHSYKSMLCDTLIIVFMHSFISSIYKCKRISPTGASQLLLDLTTLSNFLKTLLALGDPEKDKFDEEEINAFASKVAKASAKPEAILRVLLAPEAFFLETYRSLIQGASQQDLAIMMELRGLGNNEKISLLQQYERKEKSESNSGGSAGKRNTTTTTTTTATTGISSMIKGKASNTMNKMKTFVGN